jgi:hypothetical protein
MFGESEDYMRAYPPAGEGFGRRNDLFDIL